MYWDANPGSRHLELQRWLRDSLKTKVVGAAKVTLTFIDIRIWDCIPKDYMTRVSFVCPGDNEKSIGAFRGMSLGPRMSIAN